MKRLFSAAESVNTHNDHYRIPVSEFFIIKPEYFSKTYSDKIQHNYFQISATESTKSQHDYFQISAAETYKKQHDYFQILAIEYLKIQNDYFQI